LRDELHEALQRLRPGEGLAVHCLDLDRFKEVNDAIGHGVGDQLLQQFAARLHRLGGNGTLLARTGGNEFVIVQSPARAPTDATDLAVRVIEAMNEPFVLGDHFQVVLSASIGIAMAPGDGTDVDLLIKHANLALHRAKQEQRGHYRFFEKDMDARMQARHELERNLRSALTDGELELDFQPLLNVKRNEISGFEALLRWRMSSGEVIPPGAFIPLAEETGLIVPMGEWALRQALAAAAKWPRQIRVAVNLSPVQFNSRNLSQVVMSALAASGVEAGRLELEITESLLLQDRDTTLATLHQLRDLGVRIALDDFGTGFSSLNYLRAFPFDKLKIDQCFIAGLAEGNEESLAIVRAVARLGSSLGIATTAEGIETQVQMDIARREGFTEVQGYWIGMPESAEVVAEKYDLYRRTTKPRRAAAKGKVTPLAAQDGDEPEKPRRARRVRSA
jgi:diguanylate cyclase (GGDEF)-like protein